MQFLTLREIKASPYISGMDHVSTFITLDHLHKIIFLHHDHGFCLSSSILPLTRSTESDDGRENGNEIVMKVMEMREERREGSIK